MKFAIILTLLAIVLLSGYVKAEDREAVCDNAAHGCQRNYDPVCGTDGTTYSNECVLCEENLKRNVQTRVSKAGPC